MGLPPLAATSECLEHHRFSMPFFCGKDLVHSRVQSSLSEVTLTPEIPKRAYPLKLDFSSAICSLRFHFVPSQQKVPPVRPEALSSATTSLRGIKRTSRWTFKARSLSSSAISCSKTNVQLGNVQLDFRSTYAAHKFCVTGDVSKLLAVP